MASKAGENGSLDEETEGSEVHDVETGRNQSSRMVLSTTGWEVSEVCNGDDGGRYLGRMMRNLNRRGRAFDE